MSLLRCDDTNAQLSAAGLQMRRQVNKTKSVTVKNKASIDQAFQRATDSKAVPGIVATAATSKDIIYQGAFGLRDISKNAAMTMDSVFWLASMTKAISATAAMQLVEQGKLSLDDPIGSILSEFSAPKVLEGFAADGVPQLRDARKPVTLRNLLTHTAGFWYDLSNPDMLRYVEATGAVPILSCQRIALQVPLASDPGTRWEYGLSLDVVGLAVEAASGKRLDAYMRDHIFAPLGMNDSGFKIGEDQRSRLVAMHARGADGSLSSIPFEVEQNPEMHLGGAGLYSTAPDYIKFTQMILNNGSGNGHQILKPETVALMAQNHIGDLEVMPLPSSVPHLSKPMVDLYPGIVKKWGLSSMITTEKTPEGRSAGSLTWSGLANTFYWIDAARDVTGVIMMQVLPFGDQACLDTFAGFERGVYAALRT
jgi:methyl acetate hydrolase